MTNLEIVTNLFQNLEKFEQSVFLTKFNNSDSLNVTKITKDGYKIEINIDKAFDKSPKIDTNCEMMCINFFESINIDEVINTKNDLELIEFLSLYHTNTITYSQMYAKDLKFNLQKNMCFDCDKNLFNYAHKDWFTRYNYDIITFEEFKKRLIFKPKLK